MIPILFETLPQGLKAIQAIPELNTIVAATIWTAWQDSYIVAIRYGHTRSSQNNLEDATELRVPQECLPCITRLWHCRAHLRPPMPRFDAENDSEK